MEFSSSTPNTGPDPRTLIWENLDVSRSDHWARFLAAWVVAGGVLAVSALLFLGMKDK
jgi:hypothetical protein